MIVSWISLALTLSHDTIYVCGLREISIRTQMVRAFAQRTVTRDVTPAHINAATSDQTQIGIALASTAKVPVIECTPQSSGFVPLD